MELFDNNEEFNDFKLPEEETAFVNEAVKREAEENITELEAFKENFDEPLLESENPKDKLTEIVLEYIQESGDVNEVSVCTYDSNNGIALDGWEFNGDEDLVTVDLFLTEFVDPAEGDKISTSILENRFKRLLRFYEYSVNGTMLGKFVNDPKSDLYQVADLIHSTAKIDRIRFFILTNAIAPNGYGKDSDMLGDTVCEYNVWDVKRILQQNDIISGKGSIVVDFEGDYDCTLPCIQMPDVSNHVKCYLCIIPGKILYKVYRKYHQQLLEMNVRTFLQFKGASNKGIRDTLIGHVATPAERKKGIGNSKAEPDMFFAYNNGLSATASEVKLNEEGNAITKIKSWQIVNGGQTTAAISAVMGMKDIDVSKLSSVYVAMKISVVKDKDMLTVIVPKISRYANTQSAVKKSDFNINEDFLVKLEQQSRNISVLTAQGTPVGKWFFERTRGQYLDKAKRFGTAKGEKEFYAEFPKNQMFDKTTLSKIIMSWEQNPASVCKGGENNYTTFYEMMKNSKIEIDKNYYHCVVAKTILFKAIDALYGKYGIQLPGYKSNMVAYTMSLLSLASQKKLDLEKIWSQQCVMTPSVYKEMTIDIYNVYAKLVCGAEHIGYKIKESYTDTNGKRKNHYVPKEISQENIERLKSTVLYEILVYVKKIENFIYKHLIDIEEGQNINEWTKKTKCWDELKIKWANTESDYQVPNSILKKNDDDNVEITEGQKKKIDAAMAVPADVWFSLYRWSKNNVRKLTPIEQAWIGQVGYNIQNKKMLSYKVAKMALDIYEKAVDAGWNEQ